MFDELYHREKPRAPTLRVSLKIFSNLAKELLVFNIMLVEFLVILGFYKLYYIYAHTFNLKWVNLNLLNLKLEVMFDWTKCGKPKF